MEIEVVPEMLVAASSKRILGNYTSVKEKKIRKFSDAGAAR